MTDVRIDSAELLARRRQHEDAVLSADREAAAEWEQRRAQLKAQRQGPREQDGVPPVDSAQPSPDTAGSTTPHNETDPASALCVPLSSSSSSSSMLASLSASLSTSPARRGALARAALDGLGGLDERLREAEGGLSPCDRSSAGVSRNASAECTEGEVVAGADAGERRRLNDNSGGHKDESELVAAANGMFTEGGPPKGDLGVAGGEMLERKAGNENEHTSVSNVSTTTAFVPAALDSALMLGLMHAASHADIVSTITTTTSATTATTTMEKQPLLQLLPAGRMEVPPPPAHLLAAVVAAPDAHAPHALLSMPVRTESEPTPIPARSPSPGTSPASQPYEMDFEVPVLSSSTPSTFISTSRSPSLHQKPPSPPAHAFVSQDGGQSIGSFELVEDFY